MSAPRRTDRLRRLLGDLGTAATMPRIAVVVSRGGDGEDELLAAFRRRHPRYRVVGRKVVGVALLALDDVEDADAYLAGLRYARRRVRRATRLGYRAAPFDPAARRAEVQAIRTSLPERQGRAMDPEFLDPGAPLPTGAGIEYLGVFRGETLAAYVQLQYAGDIVGMMDLFGHGEHLGDGIMFMLVAAVVDRAKRTRPQARFIYYDMYFGASDGLRAFKRHAGFQPYYVRWRRVPPTPAARPEGPAAGRPAARA